MTVIYLMLAAAVPGCEQCHAKQAQAHQATAMAQTLARPESSEVFRRHPRLEWTLGRFRYEVTPQRYRVSDGTQSLDAVIRWAVGQGEAGQTWVLERDGKLWESRASYYARVEGLGPTIGAPAGEPKSLAEALGRELAPRDTFECFNCHSAPTADSAKAVRGSLAWTETLRTGVQCESCHQGAAAHRANPAQRPPSLRSVGAEEMSEVCGKCHRTWADIASNGPRGIGNVRFQPYRIARSKCYDATDARIGCVACHDAHSRPDRSLAVAATDRTCASCHGGGCKAGHRQDCASCHMPKYELPGSYFRFTDHWIRTVRNKNEYPD